jgi:hypothetical protein
MLNQFIARFRSAIRKCKFVLCLILCTLALSASGNAQQGKITKFDAPSAGAGFGQGTTSTGINLFGVITGNVTDDNYGTHGFVRTSDGTFTNFDVPGADPIVGCTCPGGINDLGAIVGYYIDTNGVGHGFLRARDGTFTSFDDADAGVGRPRARHIQVVSMTLGKSADSSSPERCCPRFAYPGGNMTIDVPSGYRRGRGTYAGNIIPVHCRHLHDGNFVSHGFVRTPPAKSSS